MNNFQVVVDAGHASIGESQNKRMAINFSKYKKNKAFI